jgi:hypothetical protein
MSIAGTNGFEYDFTYNTAKQLVTTFYKNPDNSFYGPNSYETFRYKSEGVAETYYSLTNTANPDSFNVAFYNYATNRTLVNILFPDLITGNIVTSIDNIQYDASGNIASYFDNHDSTDVTHKPGNNIFTYSSRDAKICPSNNKIAFTVLDMYGLWGPLFYSFFSKEITTLTTVNDSNGGIPQLFTYTYLYNTQGWVTKITETTLETPQGNPGGNIPVNLEYKFEY